MQIAKRLRAPAAAKTIKGGEIITRILAAEGIKHVFGIIDGTYFGMYSTFGAHGIELITPRHETCAVHMAGAYARLKGELGVCMASNGPGVANALPGVAVEEAEGNRVLLITSCRRAGISYPERGGTFQYFPQVDVIGAMAKFSVAVPTVDRLAELTRKAIRESFTGRPGVVHLDVPESIMNTAVDVDPSWFREPGTSHLISAPSPSSQQISEAAKLLLRASKPMIHAGSGVLHAGAWDELNAVAELLDAPITTSWGARAVLDERSDHALPMMYTAAVKKARCEADMALVVGSRLGETDFWGKAPYWATPAKQQVIQVDLEPAAIGNNRPVALGVQADVKVFLQLLADELGRRFQPERKARKRWLARLTKARNQRRAKLDEHLQSTSMPMHPAHVAGTCQDVFGDNAVLVVDGGNTSIWGHFYHQVRTPNTVLGTAKMGMLGAGVSQAVAAKVARPNSPVVCIIGDGAMAFHQQEVETAVRNNLQVVWVVLCDKQWGMVKINQQFALKPVKTLAKKAIGQNLSPDETINTDLHEIEFDVLGRAMGAHGERVADPTGLNAAIKRAVASGKPAVIHVDVDPVAHLWAPELKTFKDMHAEPAGK